MCLVTHFHDHNLYTMLGISKKCRIVVFQTRYVFYESVDYLENKLDFELQTHGGYHLLIISLSSKSIVEAH